MIRNLFIICFIATVSCSGNDNTPNRVLSEDEMTSVLIDIYVTEAKITSYSPHIVRDSAFIVFEALKKDVLEKYDISDTTLRESLEYYFERPEQLNDIYSRVIDSLSLKEQKLQQTENPSK